MGCPPHDYTNICIIVIMGNIQYYLELLCDDKSCFVQKKKIMSTKIYCNNKDLAADFEKSK